MTERSSLDDLAEASRQMATRLAGIEAHLHGHRYTLINTDLLNVWRLSGPNIAGALDQQANTVHKRLQRASDRAELFVVVADKERLVPAVLLDEALDTRPEWQPVIEALRASNMSGWAMWGWIAEPNAGLSGDIAAEVITTDPERVYAAAQQRLVQATS